MSNFSPLSERNSNVLNVETLIKDILQKSKNEKIYFNATEVYYTHTHSCRVGNEIPGV